MKKKLILLLTAVVLLTMAIAPAYAWEVYYVKTGNGKSLNVRRSPSHSGEIIGSAGYGESLAIQYFQGGWGCVIWGSMGDAWVSAKYLTKTKPGPYVPGTQPAKKPAAKKADGEFDLQKSYVGFKSVNYAAVIKPDTTFVNLRWGPAKKAGVMGIRFDGDSVVVIAENSTWCQVYDPATNECGFIMKEFVLPTGGNEG